MKILYIDQYFSNREGISGTRAYEFARRWTAQGHRVTVLACTSRYSHLGAAAQRRLIARSTVDGIEVVAVRVRYAQQMSTLARLRSFFGFMFWATVIGLFLPRHDVVFASSTPLTVGVPGVIISRLRGVPFVFEIRDLWPRAPIEMGSLKNPAAIAVARLAERLFYRAAVQVVALSPGQVEGVIAAGTPPEKVVLVPNACDLDLFDAASPKGIREGLGVAADDVLVIHAGNLGAINGCHWMLDLAAQWRKTGHNRLHLLLLGEGNQQPELMRRTEREGLTNVHFAGPVSRREAADYIVASDLGLISVADVPVLATASPNKFFDTLAAGQPALVNIPGWTADLVETAQAGLCLSRDPAAAAAVAAELAGDAGRRRAMGEKARELAAEFERGRLGARLLEVLTRAAQRRTCGLEPSAKRLTDLLLAGLALLLSSPLLLLLALAIKLDSPGGAFFFQERLGRDARPFRLWKFRTMVTNAAALGDGLNVGERDPRITRIGRWLREWSLDELPQVINIVLGDMAIVGPRPALREHVAQYSAEQRDRLLVKPGLTGLAQISGRNALTWDEKLACDVRYARTWSWWGDMKIILKTLPVVLGREGLYEKDAGKEDRFNRFNNDD